MVNQELQSPNAIPPRTSSTGAASSSAAPAKSVLQPVPEGSWIGSSTSPTSATHRRMNSSSSSRGSNRPLSSGFPKGDGSHWTAEQEKVLLGPYDYMMQNPGKDMRRQLVAAFNAWLKVPEDRLAIISKVITMLHNASLLIDDVEDSSLLRRGEPVAHNVFGIPQTLNSGNYVYFLALQELLQLDNPRLVEIFAQELCNLHRGQGMDLYWRDTLTCPTEAEYLDMVGNKTGGLFRLAIKLMQAESSTNKDCLALVNLMGLAFQIRDDYMNLWSTDYTQHKGLAEDLTEGKFSYPVIHAIRSNPSNMQLLNILRQKTTDPAVKRYAVDYMERSGSFAHTKAVIGEMLDRARALVSAVDAGAGESGPVLAILDKFAV